MVDESKKKKKQKKSEEKFLKTYDPKNYEKLSVAVDLLIFTIVDQRLKILMVRREEMPYQDCLALPGVFVGVEESLDDAVKRGLKEETGLENIYFEQLYTWGEVKRDPRMRIISVSYMALVPYERIKPVAGQRVTEVKLADISGIMDETEQIAFDHKDIILYARQRLKNKVEYTKIAFEFVEEEFTLPQLQRVYEIILNKPLYKANFRKKIAELVEETNRRTSGDRHRPSKFYRLKG